MPASVRLARLSDADDIARLTRQLGYESEAAAVAARLTAVLSRPDQQFLVAEHEGQVVGWVHALVSELIDLDRFVVIGGLVVDRSQRRNGVGRLLMRHVEDWASQNNCSVVRLWSSAGRTGAHAFYQELGYRNIKTQHTFAKSLDPDRRGELQNLVPRLDEGPTLIGTWRLTSCEARGSAGDVRYPFGEHVSGQLIYDAAGNMSAHVMRASRQVFATADAARGTDAEVRAAFESHTSYFGTYTVDPTGQTVTHHVKGASFPNWVGHDQLRHYRFDRGRLLISTPPLAFGGQSLEYVLVWERVR